MQRKAIGRKGDGYVRSIGSRSIDWAASEAGPKWEGERGTKLINECDLILPKVLKDIFIDLARKIDFEDDKVRKINIPGFIHSGLYCTDMLLELKLIEITNAQCLFM
jgi:hypothetical protein